MPIIHYPDNFKIEVVKHYKMHRNIDLTLEKYGIARILVICQHLQRLFHFF